MGTAWFSTPLYLYYNQGDSPFQPTSSIVSCTHPRLAHRHTPPLSLTFSPLSSQHHPALWHAQAGPHPAHQGTQGCHGRQRDAAAGDPGGRPQPARLPSAAAAPHTQHCAAGVGCGGKGEGREGRSWVRQEWKRRCDPGGHRHGSVVPSVPSVPQPRAWLFTCWCKELSASIRSATRVAGRGERVHTTPRRHGYSLRVHRRRLATLCVMQEETHRPLCAAGGDSRLELTRNAPHPRHRGAGGQGQSAAIQLVGWYQLCLMPPPSRPTQRISRSFHAMPHPSLM